MSMLRTVSLQDERKSQALFKDCLLCLLKDSKEIFYRRNAVDSLSHLQQHQRNYAKRAVRPAGPILHGAEQKHGRAADHG